MIQGTCDSTLEIHFIIFKLITNLEYMLTYIQYECILVSSRKAVTVIEQFDEVEG